MPFAITTPLLRHLLGQRAGSDYQRFVRAAFDRGRVGGRRPRDLDAGQWAAAFRR